MAKSTRITISFPGNLWKDISRHAQHMNLRSGAQLVTALATVAVDEINRRYRGEAMPQGNLHDEVQAIFAELAAYEPQPEGIVPKKPRSTSLSMYECKEFYKRMGYLHADDADDAESETGQTIYAEESGEDDEIDIGTCCDDDDDADNGD